MRPVTATCHSIALVIVLAGCGEYNHVLGSKKGTGSDHATAPLNGNGAVQPSTPAPGSTTTVTSSPQQDCESKGAQYEWRQNTCVTLPQITLTGAISGSPGMIWQANRETCQAFQVDGGSLYDVCQPFDVTFPLALVAGEATSTMLAFKFPCSSSQTFAAEIVVNTTPPTKLALGANGTASVPVLLDGKTAPQVEIKIPSPYFVGRCELDLVTNNATLSNN